MTGSTVLDRTIVASDFLVRRREALERLVPLSIAKAWLERFLRRTPADVDLIYAYNHPVFKKVPWVVHTEWVHILTGWDVGHFPRFKGLVERMLASDYCKGILTWGDWARQSILTNLDCTDFAHKIEVVPPGVRKKEFIRNRKDGKIRLLFVGSANNPHRFDHKGGREVLEVFRVLSRRYDNLELTMRVRIPEDVRAGYQDTLSMDNVRVIEGVLPGDALAGEFVDADVFLYPTHEMYNTVIQEAMSYGLPVTTTDMGSTGRLEHGRTGIVVRNSERVPYFWSGRQLKHIPAGRALRPEFERAIRSTDPVVVEELARQIALLIEDPELRLRVGDAARYEVEEGELSITRRNEKLKRIFDSAVEEAPKTP